MDALPALLRVTTSSTVTPLSGILPPIPEIFLSEFMIFLLLQLINFFDWVILQCADDVDPATGTSLYPSHRCKTIHLVRHAQGIHNVAAEKNHDAYKSCDYFDAQLSQDGWKQVENLHKDVHEVGLSKKIELVITSPLLRVCRWDRCTSIDGGKSREHHLLQLSFAENVWELILLIREGASTSIELFFLLLIFHWQIENDDDILWTADTRETDEHVAERGMKFINWLWTRKEKEIAVVTHNLIIVSVPQWLLLTEVCWVQILRQQTSLGKIPSGLDLPSDVAAE
ncbi:hypothetical protein Patl1_08717 [Pistacia atlantica]|uniref:Uncharacterized protein n=1 Tax=Pistacia atlantica TaxID=434234 RepID=A0ACC1AEB5_9ROSI|nr:hypothetical protein Patl1_08717 [Pistacia atlantica]